MSFISSLTHQQCTAAFNRQPLWTYDLKESGFQKLSKKLASQPVFQIDPRDAALYYSEWWKRCYMGGKPSKQEVYESLLTYGSPRFSSDDFYKLARRGAQQLGVKWIKKQNTLYFRSLLLQGGLPLAHISQNQGAYQDFLQAVLDEQPETIEDFTFNPDILKYLPPSSQNDIVYENCLAIVKSILKDEDTYDVLFQSDDSLKRISDSLKVRKQSLEKRIRESKPQNYWLLRVGQEGTEISLRIGLADAYTVGSLTNILGFHPDEREYQLFVNEDLICVFRRTIGGGYRTEWYGQQSQTWNGESNLPYSYVISGGKKRELKDFIQSTPNLTEPSLWTRFSDDEWRLVKGGGTRHKEAALLFPSPWQGGLEVTSITIDEVSLSWMPFEGETSLVLGEETRRYRSEVRSFDWTLVSEKPNWIVKGSLPIMQGNLRVNVYDERNRIVPEDRREVWVRRKNSLAQWTLIRANHGPLPLGYLEVKIIFEDVIAFDACFNLGDLQVSFQKQAIDQAEVQVAKWGGFQFRLEETPDMEANRIDDGYALNLISGYARIPTVIKGTIGHRNGRSLRFEMRSPFEGLAMTDHTGRVLERGANLSFADLYGVRLLCTPGRATTLVMRNDNDDHAGITIEKEINLASFPLISFIDEITRLLYINDVMDHRSRVSLTMTEGNSVEVYYISKFSHTLDIEQQAEFQVKLLESNDELDLFAIPLSGRVEDLQAIPLVSEGGGYALPRQHSNKQFIIVSPLEGGTQVMPRFVNCDEAYEGESREARISQFHDDLANSAFTDDAWERLLVYFNICKKYEIPYSTFDQVRALSMSSQVAARAFFFLGINQDEVDIFIQKVVPNLEQELGFCFHWAYYQDWGRAFDEVLGAYGQNKDTIEAIAPLLALYLQESGLEVLNAFINTGNVAERKQVLHSDIRHLRASLGERVLNELPDMGPAISSDYQIPIHAHLPVKVILKSAIAVGESVKGVSVEKPIWGGDDHRSRLRRYIQYSQYLHPQFYSDIILHVLSNS